MPDPRRKTEKKGRRGSGSRRPHIEEEELLESSPEASEDPEIDVEAPEELNPDERDELLDRYQRLAAEFDNYRKRQARDFNRLIDQGRKKLVSELLTVLDNFDRARETAQGEHSDKEIVDGILQTYQQLKGILKREGLEELPSVPGDQFDPNIHEAMFAEDIEEGDFDVVLEVYQKAYRFGQDLLRPARVKVGRAPARNGG